MREVARCRKMAATCRQRAAFYQDERWAWLAKANMWEDRAADHIKEHYKECNLPRAVVTGAVVNPATKAESC